MRFGILGPLVVADDEGRELALGGPKQRSVLAILLLHAGEVVSSDRLIEELWGEGAPAKATKTLYVYISNLRKTLGEGVLSTRSPGYVLRTDGAEVDVDRFQALVAEGRRAFEVGDADSALASLRDGLELWRGPPLADLTYERFAQGEIARLSEARLSALEDRIDTELWLGRPAALVGELESLVREHPLRERLRSLLMLALYRSGRQVEALDAYRQLRDQLSEELGLEPSPELRALQSAILNQDPSLTVVGPDESVAGSGESDSEEVIVVGRRQRKVVTALFCDVVGSTERGAQLDPEVLSGVIDRYSAQIREVIESHGGTVDTFISGTVNAVFGIPQVREDDALRAVRAATEISERLGVVARDAGVSLGCRLGVNTGLVLVGDRERLAIGDAVTAAGWLQQAAAPGEILIGAETLRLVRDAARVQPLDPVKGKGMAVPIAAFRVLEVDQFARGVARRLDTPLVGRERELGWLRDAWLRSVQEPGCQLVTLLGTAGVGKSRLAAELLAGLNQEALVLGGRCLPYGEGITFWPLLEALASVEGAAEQVLDRLESGTAAIREELFLDIRRLLEACAGQQPVILCIDDLQWAQPTLLDLLEHLVDLSRGVPILVLCLARPELFEDHPGWAGGKLRATNLLLDPLGANDCETLVTQLDDGLDPEAQRQAVAASEGNPLFLEELVALARESGKVMASPTIQALLAARIERLPVEEREVLERGAIEGEVFHRSATAALAPTRAPGLDLALASLVRKELIRAHPPTLPGDDAFRFRHLLMRDVVYDGQPKEARAGLHERFARWLLEETTAEFPERDEIAGWHLERAVRYQQELGQEVKPELLVLAADELRAAGRRASRRADVPAVTSFLERALALIPDDDIREAVISCELAEQLIEAGEFERADALLSAAERYPEASTLAALGRLEWLLHAQTSDALQGIRASLPPILERLARTGDDAALARAHLASGALHWLQGQADDTLAEARIAAGHASKAQDRALRERALRWYAWALRWGSAPAAKISEELEQLEREEPGPCLAAEIDICRAELARYRGRFKEATDLLQRAIDTYRALGRYDTMAGHGQRMGETELLAGDAAAAVKTLLGSDTVLAERGERGLRSTIQAQLAQAYEQLGNSDAAHAAIALAENLGGAGDIVNYVITHGVRARLALREGRCEEAERWARSSVTYACTTDSILDQGYARLNLARVLASLGQDPEASQESRAAGDLLAAKGDEFARDKAQALLDQLASTSTFAE